MCMLMFDVFVVSDVCFKRMLIEKEMCLIEMEFIEENEIKKEITRKEEELEELKEEEEEEKLIDYIHEDHCYIRENISEPAILTITREYICIIIMRTAYSRLQLRIQYPINYPNEIPIIELSSPSLPPPLLRNKEKECQDISKENIGKSQFSVIYELLYNFVHTNLFIPCWKEVKQVMTLCEGKGNISANEKEGLLRFRLREGEYKQDINIHIPYLYPEEGVEIEFLPGSNFPSDIQTIYLSQAQEISRRCVAGFLPDYVNDSVNSLHFKPSSTLTSSSTESSTSESTNSLTSSSLQDIKHNVNVLKQFSDLRLATQYGNSQQGGNIYSQKIKNSIKREARKDLKKLTQTEAEYEKEQLELLKQQEQQAMIQLMRTKISTTSQPSLFVVMKFLLQEYVVKLPNEKCQKCNKNILLSNTNENQSSPSSSSTSQVLNNNNISNNEGITKKPKKKNNDVMSVSERKPIRSICGHWFHFKCIDEWLTTPPFLRQCLVCSKRIYHPDWPEDVKAIERTWQAQQAKKREISDVADFLDMGGDFRKIK